MEVTHFQSFALDIGYSSAPSAGLSDAVHAGRPIIAKPTDCDFHSCSMKDHRRMKGTIDMGSAGAAGGLMRTD